MTKRSLDLPVLLPRGAECAGCVTELGRELQRVDGVEAVDADVARGLVHVSFDTEALPFDQLNRYARRIGAQAHCPVHCPDGVHEHAALDLKIEPPDESHVSQRLAHVTGLDCADCAMKLEAGLKSTAGVVDAGINFGAATLKVSFDPSALGWDQVLQRVRALGYDTVEARQAETGFAPAPGGQRGFWFTDRRALLTFGSGLLVAGGFAAEAPAPDAAPFLFAAAMVMGGSFVARAAFYSLRARSVDMNVLMTLAAVGAAAIGQWSEAGLVIFLFALGNVLQLATLERTRDAIRGLAALAPAEATVLRDGKPLLVPVSEVAGGDLLLVRPGERLAVDGVVTSGSAAVDQAPITGESMPVGKQLGDQVFAGSIVEGGSLTVRATSAAADNTIAKIVHLVEEAQAERAPVQGLVDRFAARYTPAVVGLAVLVAVVPPLLGAPLTTWFYRGLALLIISCPCALVISTPVSILAALGTATRRGTLVKGGVYLEQAARLRAVALDKTGTLTEGAPQVTDVVAFDGVSRGRVLAVAAACERHSEHALARAIVAAANGTGHAADGSTAGRAAEDLLAVERFRPITGRGVRGDVEGQTYFVGRPELFGAHAADPALTATIAGLEKQGKTVVAVGTLDEPLGVIAIADPVRPGADEALRALRAQGVEHIVMLTGDNESTAQAIGRQVGVDEVRAGLLPEDKVDAVRDLGERFGATAMVGDGVNDAPALAAAHLGIAMGAAGTDAALETADVALMGDDLAGVAGLMRLSRRTRRIVAQNIAFAIAVKGTFLVLAPLGLVTLWMAVFADMGTSLAVIGNGLRLRR